MNKEGKYTCIHFFPHGGKMLIVLKFLFCSFYIHVQSRPLDRGGGQAIPHEETHDHQRLTGQAQSKEDWTTQGAD